MPGGEGGGGGEAGDKAKIAELQKQNASLQRVVAGLTGKSL